MLAISLSMVMTRVKALALTFDKTLLLGLFDPLPEIKFIFEEYPDWLLKIV